MCILLFYSLNIKFRSKNYQKSVDERLQFACCVTKICIIESLSLYLRNCILLILCFVFGFFGSVQICKLCFKCYASYTLVCHISTQKKKQKERNKTNKTTRKFLFCTKITHLFSVVQFKFQQMGKMLKSLYVEEFTVIWSLQ